MGQGHSLFKQCQNLPPGDCWAAVQPVYAVLEPTSQRLWCMGAASLCSVRTYLPGTEGQGHSLFMQCQNLPPDDCEAGMHPVYAVWNLPLRDCGAGAQAV